uniref:Uncharacterized protein n=1 Tax=viral metagenome TaxID=1070528 RepID=A0A6C0JLK7_9ZZZZ
MWYHYLAMLVALYLIGSSIYNIVMAGNQSGWIVNGVTTAIGGAMAYYAYSGITAPVLPPPFVGGKRYRW